MELIIGFGLAVLGIIGAAISRQLTDECKAWTPWIVKRLIRRAVHKLSEEQQGRFEEEWLAYVDEIPGEIGKVVAALGFLRASHRMSSRVTASQRAFSVIVSIALLLLFFPLLVSLTISIKLWDGGPVFVRVRRRNRKDGRIVHFFEFRTTRLGVEKERTRIGYFLAFSGLYRLPDLINVLRGDLSVSENYELRPEAKQFFRKIVYPSSDWIEIKRVASCTDYSDSLSPF